MKERDLTDLPSRSPKGDKVYAALCDVHPGDTRLELSARRAGRATTAADAQARGKNQPLEKFFLCGTMFSSIPLWVRVFAETWLGKTWDLSPSFSYVNCGDFPAANPGMLAQLVGPMPINELGQQSLPLLGLLDSPHFGIRSSETLRVLYAWRDKFVEGLNPLERFGRQMGGAFLSEFYILLNAEINAIYRAESKKAPFYSMLFFDGVDHASPSLKSIILGILTTGSLMLYTGRADFSRTVVIVSTYREPEFFAYGPLGFAAEVVGSSYGQVRKRLLKDYGGADTIARATAENVFIIPDRTLDSQKKRAERSLQDLAEYYRDSFGVQIEYTDCFLEGFVEDTREESLGKEHPVFTEDRIESGIRRHILDFIHRLTFFGELSRGTKVVFDCVSPPQKKFESKATLIEERGGERITPEVFGKDTRHDDIEEQGLSQLVGSNPALKELNQKAMELWQRYKSNRP